MSRGFNDGGRTGNHYLYLALWALLAVTLVFHFFRLHPPRPLFGEAGTGAGGPFPWARHAASAGGAALWLLLLVPAGGAIARLIGLRGGRNPLLLAALGAIYAMAAAFAALAAGLFRPAAMLVLLALPLAAWMGRPSPVRLPRFDIPGPAFDRVALLFVVLALAWGLARALAPLTGNDALVYHMALAAEYARSGGFTAPDWCMYARVPHGIELLYAEAFLTGAEGAARVVHFLLFAGNVVLAGALSRRLTKSSGSGAAFLFAWTPLFLDPRTVGNVDLGASLFFGLALYQILAFRESGERGDLAAAGLFAAALLWVKYAVWSAWPLLPLALFLLACEKGKRPAAREWLLFAAPSIVAAAIWFARASVVSGHPLFPMVAPPGNGAGWDGLLASRLREWQMGIGMGRGPFDFLLLPWNLVMHGQPTYSRFDGVLSPLYLVMLPPAALLGGSTVRRLLALAAAGVILWALGPQQVRFLSPVLLLLAGLLGDSWRNREWVARARRLAFLPPVIFLLGAVVPAVPHAARDLREILPVVTGAESREAYLSRRIQSYDAFRMLGEAVPPGGRVLLVWENRIYYSPRRTLCDSFFEASQVMRMAEKAGAAPALIAELRDRGIGWILVNRPLQNVFARHQDPAALATVEGVIARSEAVGRRKGLELYRLPGA